MKTRIAAPLAARRGDPKGQVLVLFALMLVVLLLVSALAVDYGGWLVTKRNYQNASDAASLAGAQQLTRPLGAGKNLLARQAAWESVKTALNLTGLTPATQALTSSAANSPYVGENYTVWVASPPADAGAAYLGHTSGPGNVYVRIEHAGQTFLSNIAGMGRTVTAWSTAGRFPANFAVIGLCSPNSVTANCLAGDANIKLDGTSTNLIVNTGDVGTNRWTKSGGGSSGVALGADSNAYMQLFDSCWNASGNQCNLFGYSGGAINTSDIRSAIPLGAPIQDPKYPAPAVSAAATPNQCRGTGTVQLASTQVIEHALPDVQLAAAVQPQPSVPGVVSAAGTNNDLTGFVKATLLPSVGAPLNNITVTAVGPTATYTMTTDASGQYTQKKADSGTYSISASDPAGVYHSTAATPVSVAVPTSGNGTITAPQINMQKNPTISGTIFSSAGGTVSGATISITGSGGPYNRTANGSGAYGPVSISGWGATNTWNVNASATGYVSNLGNSGFLSLDMAYTVNVTLTVQPASLTGTITDAVTSLPVPGVIVMLNTGESATTNAAGVYNIASTASGTKTVTLSGTAIVATSGYAYSTPSSGGNLSVFGATTQNYTVWPKGCYDGNSSGSFGKWQCDWPSGNNCPAPTNTNAATVGCTLTQANAIRPGTYSDITLANGTCAWLDAKGGVTGVASGQSGGIYHIKGNLSIGSGSYLFGDGVTLVFDQGANIDVANDGGWILNYGSLHTTPSNPATACDFNTAKAYNDGSYACFRSIDNTACAASPSATTCPDYAYAAWTTKSHLLWSGTQTPTYSDATVAKGSELGITFFFYCPSNNPQCGLGNNSRMKLATASMGYLFNGVMYGPGDDIQLGGGKDGQTAAGQIVGWTIEYHGGTRIEQNWYGNPVDGQPFLIEPILGE